MSTARLQNGTIVKDIADNTINSRSFKVGRLLGKGGFALCYEMMSVDSLKLFAGKVIAKSSLSNATAKSKLITEIKLHRSISHRNVVKFFNFFEDKHNVYIILELCKHQTLLEMVKRRGRLTTAEVQYFMLQIVDAVGYLNDQNIIHRDLKLGNLFLHESLCVKVGDFGLAAILETDEERKRTLCGTPNYLAPEVLDNVAGGHSFEVDVWSIGVIMYTLLVGRPPFETTDVKATYARIRSNSYEYPHDVQVSSLAKDLISRMLVLLPERRASLADIRRHAFFNLTTPPSELPLIALTQKPWTDNLLKYNVNAQNINLDVSMLDAEVVEKSLCLMSDDIERSFARKHHPEALNQPLWPRPTLFIVKTLDYTKKYGLGYLMSDGSVGISFNDSSKIILASNASLFHYYERRCLIRQVCTIDSHPKELKKKVLLLQHFTKNLVNENIKPFTTRSSRSDDYNKDLLYVQKWCRSNGSIIFSMSNRNVHVIFGDKVELIVSAQRIVSYIDQNGVMTSHHLDYDLQCTTHDFRQRLRYTKDALKQMSQCRS